MPRATLVLMLLVVALPAHSQVVDHNDIARVARLPQSIANAIGRQVWFFSHASVGSNIIAGISDLYSSDATRYRLVCSSVGLFGSQNRAADPPSPTSAGRIYECPRGNPGWSAKLAIFDNSVRVSGWRHPSATAVMDKLCYIDQDANPSSYIGAMTALESAYPDTVFVYTTMPITTSADSSNALRNQYNAAVRAHCKASRKLLFDIADIEAHDPDGVEQLSSYQGSTYQRLCPAYTDDGGHLNTVGRQRLAMGWYATAAAIVPLGLSNRAASDLVMNDAAADWRFAVCGRVTVVDSNVFDLDDGSGVTVRVTANDHQLATGDTARAAGALDPQASPIALRSCASGVRRLK